MASFADAVHFSIDAPHCFPSAIYRSDRDRTSEALRPSTVLFRGGHAVAGARATISGLERPQEEEFGSFPLRSIRSAYRLRARCLLPALVSPGMTATVPQSVVILAIVDCRSQFVTTA